MEDQINACWDDLPPAALKSGMLYSKDLILAVVRSLEKNCKSKQDHIPYILDPVMVATSGHKLLSDDAVGTLRDSLLPWATMVTPNIPEAEILAGQPQGSIKSIEDMRSCAQAIGKLGPRYVYLKGGRMPVSRSATGHSDSASADVKVLVDILYDSVTGEFVLFKKDAVDSPNTHGTVWTQSAAVCAELAKANGIKDALNSAGNYVRGAIAASYPMGAGAGPVHHLHTLVKRNVPAPTQSSPHPFTDYLIAQTGELWEKYVNHPFTVQLGKGTLPMKAFLHFIRQGYLFLLHYARTHALAGYKSKNYQDLAAGNIVIQSVLQEVKANIAICAANGISKSELESTKESITCTAYSRYILDISSSGDILDLRVATTPCLLGYGEVGLRLFSKPNTEIDRSADNAYYEWISTYAQEEYQNAVKTGRDELERIVAQSPVPQLRLEELSKIFTQTTELEIAFWDDALAAVDTS